MTEMRKRKFVSPDLTVTFTPHNQTEYLMEMSKGGGPVVPAYIERVSGDQLMEMLLGDGVEEVEA